MWRLFLYDWTGERRGEILDAHNLALSFPWGQLSTVTFDISYDNLLTEEMVAADLDEDDPKLFVGAFRWNDTAEQWQGQFVGPVLTCEESAADNTAPKISIGAVGADWITNKRIMNDTANNGRKETGFAFPAIDRGLLAATLIRLTNKVDGNSWLRASNSDVSDSSEVIVSNWLPETSLAQGIEALAAGLNSFEYEFRPVFAENGELTTDSDGLILARFIAAPLLGEDKSDSVVFEYGMGLHNLSACSKKSSKESLITRASHAKTGDTAAYSVLMQDTVAISEYGVFEEVIGADVNDYELRRQLCAEHVAVRKRGRRLIECTPARSDLDNEGVPVPFADYRPGDRVSVNAFWGGRQRIAASVRVYTINITVSDGGVEEVKLSLYAE